MIDLVLITGFLGSGKTTLMQRTLEEFSGRKAGVIINDFGKINIDARIIRRDGIRMAELSNGSVFCACIKDKFVESLIEMSGADLDYLFIEASGLADPSNMEQIIRGIRKETKDVFDYIGSVCVVDAETFLELSEVLPAIRSQLEYCSAAVINKTDLADENKIESAEVKIREYNPTVKIFRAAYCGVDIKGIIEAMHKHGDIPAGKESSNTMENRADTFIVSGDKEADPDDLRAFIEDIIGDSYRIKGFVLSSEGPVQVSTVNDNIYITPWDGRLEKSELIIISSVGFRMMTTITKALDKHLKGVMKI